MTIVSPHGGCKVNDDGVCEVCGTDWGVTVDVVEIVGQIVPSPDGSNQP